MMEGTGSGTGVAAPEINDISPFPGNDDHVDQLTTADADLYGQEGYENLIDEYAILSSGFSDQYHTTDIVSPLETAEEKVAFVERNEQVADLVTLLSTTNGCREWIRRELLRLESNFLSSDTLRIFATTWNVNGKRPLVDLDLWLADHFKPINAPDVYIIGFQEVQSLSGLSAVSSDETRGAEWRNAVEKAVAKVGQYTTIAVRQMIGVVLIVLVKNKHVPFVRNIALVEAGTGILRAGGNKGGISCRFVLYDKTVCCVSTHLAAHDHNYERRNQDFHDVVRKSDFELQAPEKSPFSYRDPANSKDMMEQTDVTYAETINLLDHDVVIWVGDVNYRIDDLSAERVRDLINHSNWTELAKYDQLVIAMESGEAFQGFEELTLNFAPTYKHDRFGTGYELDEDEALTRKPAWTDRVLWRDRIRSSSRNGFGGLINAVTGQSIKSYGGLRPHSYWRHELLSSDHRPVSLCFDFDVSVISSGKRNKIVENIHMNLRKRRNLLRPRLSLSSMAVDFGKVEFDNPVNAPTPVFVRNLGHVPITVNIEKDNIPGWLQVGDDGTGLAFTLAPFQKEEINLRAHVRPGSGISTRLNMGSENIMTGVPLSILGKSDAFITVFGEYRRTCFGNSIALLAAHPKPFVISSADQERDVTETTKPTPSSRGLPVPKEIHILISYLIRGCLLHSNSSSKDNASDAQCDICAVHSNEQLFLESCDNAEMQLVREYLDEGRQIPDGTAAAAVASCLIALLDSQEEPLIPYSCYDACKMLAQNGQFTLENVELELQQAKAKAPVYNTTVYLCSFLNELPGVKTASVMKNEVGTLSRFDMSWVEDDSYFSRVLELFTRVILKPPRESSPVVVDKSELVDWEERISFVYTLLKLCSSGVVDVIFDYGLSS